MLIGNDNSQGLLSGVPTISGSGINSNTSLIGEVLHTLTAGQLPAHRDSFSGTTSTESASHTHSYQIVTFATITGGGSFQAGGGTTGATTGGESASHTHTYSGTTDSCGSCSGSAGNNTPRAMVGYWMIKL